MKIKKSLFIILSFLMIIIFIFGLSYIMYKVDCNRIYNDSQPLFALRTDELNDGGSKIYYGIFYQIIVWRKMDSYTDFNKIETHYIFNYHTFN